MENNEKITGEEFNKRNFQKGSIKPNPTRNNRTNLGGNAAPDENDTNQEATNFDTENNDLEINPGQLDGEEIDLDRTGPDTSHGSASFNPQAGTRELSQGSNNRGNSGGAGGAQYGQGSNTPGKAKPNVKSDSEKLLGQGGYGTSGTSGTNSGGQQGYQSGLGSAGSQNSSTGFNAGSQGVDGHKQ